MILLGQPHTERIHAQAKYHCKKQRRSSAEADLYAAALGASESKGMVSLWKDLGYEMKPALAIDAKATEHFFHRQGLGRLKHIDVAYMWMQDEVRSKRLRVRSAKSEEHVADLGIKPLSKAAIAKHGLTLGHMSTWRKNMFSASVKKWRCFGTSVLST